MQLETLDTTAVNIINEMKRNYEQQIEKLQADLREYHHKYLIIKEQYDLLIYKRFVRSAEELKADESQPLLFTEGGTKTETPKEKETIEYINIKPHKRNKKGRKAIDPKIQRIEKIIDLPDNEKICACGAKLTRIGQESSEKLVLIPMKLYVEDTIRPIICRTLVRAVNVKAQKMKTNQQ